MPARKHHIRRRKPWKVFISYSHKDPTRCDELCFHLTMLVRDKLIEIWYDGLIDPRTPWDKDVKDHLRAADLVLLLVSARFLPSYYCYEVEMAEALRRHKLGKAVVLPVIIGSCDWTTAPFAKFNAVPKHGHPIIGNRDRRDKGWTEVAQKVRAIVKPK